MRTEICIAPGALTLSQLRQAAKEPVQLSLSEQSKPGIHASVDTVRRALSGGRVIYGINTGFGLLANTIIPDKALEELQHSIVLSHAAGVGPLMRDATVRLMMLLRQRRNLPLRAAEGLCGRFRRPGASGAHEQCPVGRGRGSV